MKQAIALLWAWAAIAQSSPPAPKTAELMKAALDRQQGALTAQREAVRKQAAVNGVWLTPWSPAPDPAPPDCEPLADSVVAPLIARAAKAHDLQPKLIRAVIDQESGLRPCVVSAKGAQGLMQLMPDTAERLGVKDPFDPAQNIEAGATYLKQLLEKYKGDLGQALGAYNAGPGAADQAGGIPQNPETRDYVAAILKEVGK